MKENVKALIRYRELSKYVDLIPGLIHNLNTPLMSISGRMELIKFKNPDFQGVDQVLEQLNKISGMFNVLNTMIKKDKIMINEKIDVSDFVHQLDHFLHFNLSYKHKIELKNDISENLSVETIPFFLLNVLYDILNNSVEAMESGGIIKLKAFREGFHVCFEIIRDGSKISDELLTAVNDNAELDPAGEDMNDLLIAKEMINELDGKIEVKNLREGVVYAFTIPG